MRTNPNDELLQKKQADCRELFLKYGGRCHVKIEREMRERGWTDFHRRVLYARKGRPGWPDTLGWKGEPRLDRKRPACIAANAAASLSVPAALAAGNGLTHDDSTPIKDIAPPEHPKRTDLPVVTPPADGGGTDTPDPAFAPPFFKVKKDEPEHLADFRKWLKRVSPGMQWNKRFQQVICDALDRVTSGDCNRLMLFVPPRHGKSELVTVRYAAYRLKKDPSTNVVVASYGQKLANTFSRKIRRILSEEHALTRRERAEARAKNGEPPAAAAAPIPSQTPARTTPNTSASQQDRAPADYPQCGASDDEASPFPFIRQRPKNCEAEWETSIGGGLRAVGVGGGITGFGANLCIIDDPIKSRAEAESASHRDAVWNWFKNDIYTRLEPNGAMILIQTRWHEDDLAGRLIRQMDEPGGEHWDIIDMPAMAERLDRRPRLDRKRPACIAANAADVGTVETTLQDQNTPPDHAGGTGVGKRDACGPVERVDADTDLLGRAPGEALWPERYPEQRLAQIREQLGTYDYSALYQQRPTPHDGGMFKRDWFRQIIAAPPPGLRWTRGYDLGVTAGPDSDFTASYRVAFDRDGNLYIDGGYRARIEYPTQRRYILGRIAAERDTEHVIEGTHNGLALVQDLRRDPATRGRSLRALHEKEPKAARALRWVSLAESGNLFLVRGPLNQELIDEACSFPLGTHDDQIDAISLAVKAQTDRKRGFWTF